ncbi:hypothetical protein GXM_03273 [Nostoc sphaeroides CCNUC1]|uniref:Uncharacterized protein n=1 Tax=Nostoc sphaeroides CCNUC1 TaxID=2653204 RepID=A0A5P8W0J3_9NOSO|nr:hypothetical protein GXM_03273 [Nostoc sphaeroides CCNUC1]
MLGSSPRIYPGALIANCELRIANCADPVLGILTHVNFAKSSLGVPGVSTA